MFRRPVRIRIETLTKYIDVLVGDRRWGTMEIPQLTENAVHCKTLEVIAHTHALSRSRNLAYSWRRKLQVACKFIGGYADSVYGDGDVAYINRA